MIFQRSRSIIVQFFYIMIIVSSVVSCAPKITPINYETIDVEKILENIHVENNKRVSLQGVARVRAINNSDNISIKQVTILGQNYAFHIEALAILGYSVAALTSDGKKILFRTRNKQTVFEDAQNFNLSYFYPGISSTIKMREMIDILFGKVPFGLWGSDHDPFISKGNFLIVKYINSIGTETVLHIDPINKCIKTADIEIDDNNLRIEYSDYTVTNNLFFPRKIKLSYLSNKLKIVYEKGLVLNKQVNTSLLLR